MNTVTALVEASIEIPEYKTTKPFLLCPVGLIGSGKTTVTKPLAQALGLVRISGDDTRKILKERGQAYDAVNAIDETLIRKYLDMGYGIAIDRDCVTPHTQEFVRALQNDYGIPSIWIHINPPESFIIHKLRTYKHTWLFKDGDDAVENYLGRKHLHEHLSFPFVYTFDTSKEDLPRQLEEAKALIEAKLEN